MCDIHTYSDVSIYEYDPTRTLTLRTAFVRAMRRRFKRLIRDIRTVIVDQDCFGLSNPLTQVVPPGREMFAYPRTADKVKAFMEWLQKQIDADLLDVREIPTMAPSIEEAWTNMFVFDSYRRGVLRARSEMKRQGYPVPSVEQSGGIEAVMGAPFHMDAVGVLFTRVFSQLKGITSAMDNQISIVLAQGLLDGDSPTYLTRKLVATINGTGMGDLAITDSLGRFIPAMHRAETLARTEIIRAHHMANMEEYKSWEVEGVELIAEFSTAGDMRVCAECEALEKGNPYKLEDVQLMIPVHPNCRCVVIPTVKK